MQQVDVAIIEFLKSQGVAGDLLAQLGPEMEVQVNVIGGEQLADRPGVFTDGLDKWWAIRRPKKAYDDPEWASYDLPWPLAKYATAIGRTGWNWVKRRSEWVFFDFDDITSHAGVGVSKEELDQILEKAQKLPYVEVRRSTGGAGYHLGVSLDNIPTADHTEHAALARCVLGKMSVDAGFDFAARVDNCGNNFWVWRRDMPANGLELLKATDAKLTEADVPNWRDHVDVIAKRRSKTRVQGADEAKLDDLAASQKIIPFDEMHKRILDELAATGYTVIWDADNHLLTTHTCALKEVKERLQLSGYFETISEGKDPGTPNCFCFLRPNGGLDVFRFSPGITEAPGWLQSEGGWTHIPYNKRPTLKQAANLYGGKKDPDKPNTYVFPAEGAEQAAALLGETLAVDSAMRDREITIAVKRDGKLVFSFDRVKKTDGKISGWIADKTRWVREGEATVESEYDADKYDNLIRTTISETGDRMGWFLKSNEGRWLSVPKDDIRDVLKARHPADAQFIIADACEMPWTDVSIPFAPEYPGGRQWNRRGIQAAYEAADLKSLDEAHHPHWDAVLRRIFRDLNGPLKKSAWAQENGILTGGDYGLAWVANLFRHPFSPLPYLFFHGGENCGKSSLHEAIKLLIPDGVTSADDPLKNQSGFNGQLRDAVLATVEETDLSTTKNALLRIKDWVTAKTFYVRQMRTDIYGQPNKLHFIQVANFRFHCPIFPGDTRIVACYVEPMLPNEDINKDKELLPRLMEEAPHFLYTLKNIPLPEPVGRLRLPVIETESKIAAQESNKSPLENFIDHECEFDLGGKVLFKEFYERFFDWLDADDKPHWGRKWTSKAMPERHATARGTDHKVFITNLKLKEKK